MIPLLLRDFSEHLELGAESKEMVELAFVQQVTLLSTILLGFSFPVVSQLATISYSEKTEAETNDRVDANSKITKKLSKTKYTTAERTASSALVVSILCAASLLVSTVIGLALTMALSYYQARAGAMPTHAMETVNNLVAIWRWPLLAGVVSFLVAFALLGWIRSRIVGALGTVASLGAAIVMFIVWEMISRI